ncbi:hypothetical protein AVEN_118752-1 [Araneus ventricosus]|uniref:Uncharacterized protein n=1 Tax=Araneus ventricosus TaxID=182803 RepID=A0A4Y2BWS5_ARAVE|nr:hypothetical protein AVEN_118752-1 [Araneus ventricosus]
MNIHRGALGSCWERGGLSVLEVACPSARDSNLKCSGSPGPFGSMSDVGFCTTVTVIDNEECRFTLGVRSEECSCCLSAPAVKWNECFYLFGKDPKDNQNTDC